ncbi:glycosyltransferase [Paenibacillus sp. PSB04]|uniref:glycosyltransferase n=1 Tax=Paenibacillus sp. PSB04 TaxID=2866810 RepID=UPI0021F1D185|nr:glycosyltransferase [Paenibacillus sp. PSB04]UYO05189.1 glycosyltransferase [Paenibacillus sp. PSB04]
MKITSIIILTYNKLEYTQACIESIRRFTPRGTYQLIVVDNLSTDGTRDWLAEQTDILTIFNDKNVGFPKGCNQGIELATGDNILLLNNDVLVSQGWLDLMTDCLYSSIDIGAVGPVTNSAYGDQEITASYTTIDEMWGFANTYNAVTKPDWEQKLKLIGFCMLIKREVIEKVGLLDEAFSPGMCEDSDYSFRIMKAGYKNILCRNVFIHHFGSTSFGDMPEQRQQLWNRNRETFEKKWGFHTAYHTQSREDLVGMITEPDCMRKINVLDIGCACGATLLKVKHMYPNAALFGIEKNQQAATIASMVGEVVVGDAEKISYDIESYDYIFLGDILQQLEDPWGFLDKVKKSLKPDGKILASIPNAAHYSIIYSLLYNKALYGNGSVLERETKRLFTLSEIENIFEQAGLFVSKYTKVNRNESSAVSQFIHHLSTLNGANQDNHLSTVSYLVSAERKDSVSMTLMSVLEQMNEEIDQEAAIQHIVQMVQGGAVHSSLIISAVNRLEIDKQRILNVLATRFFNEGFYNDIIPLLNASLEINDRHYDTLFNYASILHSIGANDQALNCLERIVEKDQEVISLQEKILLQLQLVVRQDDHL